MLKQESTDTRIRPLLEGEVFKPLILEELLQEVQSINSFSPESSNKPTQNSSVIL